MRALAVVVASVALGACVSNVVREGDLWRIKGCNTDRECSKIAAETCPNGYDNTEVRIRSCVDDCEKEGGIMSWLVRCEP